MNSCVYLFVIKLKYLLEECCKLIQLKLITANSNLIFSVIPIINHFYNFAEVVMYYYEYDK